MFAGHNSRGLVLAAADMSVSPASEEECLTYRTNEQSEQQPLVKKTVTICPEGCSEDKGRPIYVSEFFLVVFIIWAPNVLLVIGFSAMGHGLWIFNLLGNHAFDQYADKLCIALVSVGMLFWVLDFVSWPWWLRGVALLVPLMLFCAIFAMLAPSYPIFPPLGCMIAVMWLLTKVRMGCMPGVQRQSFYSWVSGCMLLFGVVVIVTFVLWVLPGSVTPWTYTADTAWLQDGNQFSNKVALKMANEAGQVVPHNYDKLCHRNGTSNVAVPLEEQTALRHQCEEANTVLYLIWVLPAVAGCMNITAAVFLYLMGVRLQVKHDNEKFGISGALKFFVLALTLTVVGFYSSSSALAGVSMDLSNAVTSFMILGLAISMIWIAFETEMGEKMKKKEAIDSENKEFIKSMTDFLQGDWGRAMMAGTIGIFACFCLILECIRQFFRWLRGKCPCCATPEKAKGGWLGEHGEKAWAQIKEWRDVPVFLKMCLLGELFFTFQVGVAKVTFVFLSGLNDYLIEQEVDFETVLMLAFAVGFTMFLLPPVPGVPVYVFCGILLAKTGEKLIGFYYAVAAAIGLGFLLKLVACSAQYCIGYCLGKNVKVQQLIGVDKVPTRAIESILLRPGLNLGKVAVLVGGPDWPTSVTCGILRLNVFKMLLGTTPVIFVMSPCVLAGAYMAKAMPGVPSNETTLAGVFLSLSSILQGSSMFEAMRTVTNVIMQDGEKLKVSRPEHRRVEELTQKDQAYNDAYSAVTAWEGPNRLYLVLKLVILLATFLIYSSCCVFAFKGSLAFENFQVSGHINDDLDDYGLGKDPMNIVRRPVGPIVLGMFFAGVVLHVFFSYVTGCIAKCHLAKQKLAASKD